MATVAEGVWGWARVQAGGGGRGDTPADVGVSWVKTLAEQPRAMFGGEGGGRHAGWHWASSGGGGVWADVSQPAGCRSSLGSLTVPSGISKRGPGGVCVCGAASFFPPGCCVQARNNPTHSAMASFQVSGHGLKCIACEALGNDLHRLAVPVWSFPRCVAPAVNTCVRFGGQQETYYEQPAQLSLQPTAPGMQP